MRGGGAAFNEGFSASSVSLSSHSGQLLGEPDPSVPPDIHAEMGAMAQAGRIPVTTLAQRQRCMKSTSSIGVPQYLAGAKAFGYIGPNLQPPFGYKWRYKAGVWSLSQVGG